jgi:hypothetical protein
LPYYVDYITRPYAEEAAAQENRDNMSTTYLSIHDLLRITYFYEGKAAEVGFRSRSNSDTSVCSVSRFHRLLDNRGEADDVKNSSTCRHPSSATELGNNAQFAAMETDFTERFAKKKRDSGFAVS